MLQNVDNRFGSNAFKGFDLARIVPHRAQRPLRGQCDTYVLRSATARFGVYVELPNIGFNELPNTHCPIHVQLQ